MTQIVWNKRSERLFESGVDRAVLYPTLTAAGVPWNGLLSVDEQPIGGEARAYYMDGVKYLNTTAVEEFEATISAFTYPEEFLEFDGVDTNDLGVYYANQDRKPFFLSYRTGLGNDVDGIDYGYRIHLVYYAVASPTTRSNKTRTETVDPSTFSWKLTTTPINFPGRRPTAHIYIDSTKTNELILRRLEDRLYGTPTTQPKMPGPTELASIFAIDLLEVIPNYNTGLGKLVKSGQPDLMGHLSEGVYTKTPNSRLKETAEPGIYTLE